MTMMKLLKISSNIFQQKQSLIRGGDFMSKLECPFCHKLIDSSFKVCPYCNKTIILKDNPPNYIIKSIPLEGINNCGEYNFIENKTILYYAKYPNIVIPVTFIRFDYKNNKQVIYFKYDNKVRFSIFPGKNVFVNKEDAEKALKSILHISNIDCDTMEIINAFSTYPYSKKTANEKEDRANEIQYFYSVLSKLDYLIKQQINRQDEIKSYLRIAYAEQKDGCIEDATTEEGYSLFNSHFYNAQNYYRKYDIEREQIQSAMLLFEKNKKKPYVGRIDCGTDYSDLHTVYIGEFDIPGFVVAWQNNKVADIYFNSDMFKSNQGLLIALKRVFSIERSQFLGYHDEINKYKNKSYTQADYDNKAVGTESDEIQDIDKKPQDELFEILLKESRQDQSVHNIVKTMRAYQYKIVSYKFEDNIIVDGCAGSGKTMILYHRLSYILYNAKGYDFKSIYAITPTNLFKLLTNELVTSLNLERIHNLSYYSAIENFIYKYCYKFNAIFSCNIQTKINYSALDVPELYSEEYYNLFRKVFEECNCFSDDFKKWLVNELIVALNANGIYEISESDILREKELDIQKVHLALVNMKSKTENSESIYSIFAKYTFENFWASAKDNNDFKEKLIKYKPILMSICSKGEPIRKKVKRIDPITRNVSETYEINDRFGMAEIYKKGFEKALQLVLTYKIIRVFNVAIREKIETRLLILKCLYALDVFKTKYAIPKGKYSYERTYVLNILREKFGYFSFKKTLCFIDEFQNYSTFEIKTIKSLFSECAINLFGDTKQKIEAKGIQRKEELAQIGSFSNFTINDNFRNAKEITEYINQRLQMDMTPIGIEGKVVEGNLEEITFFISGRTAIIGKNILSKKKLLEQRVKHKINYVDEDGNIQKENFNVIDILNAKGLEFETVYVFENELTEKELYVALSRALNNLIVIKN